ncbi:MAG: mannose-1-phosphate guanylyltransferase [Cytophagales bacterium]|nr:MAG: mannose-1-phosphate guanylyltransferase [Cytophagales bacterium]
MNNNNYVVIMAGGIGSRFWPFSRNHKPKQFHDVLGRGKTMLQETAERFYKICPKENIYIVTNVAYKEIVKQNLPYLSDNQILLEPEGRNTAPCIAYASYKISKKNANAILFIASSDHYVMKEKEFEKTVNSAIDFASKNNDLITIGIMPTRPDTGYGYIQYDENSQGNMKKVKTFAEKPNHETALQFLASGDFVWNSGMFIFNFNAIEAAFKQFMPDLHEKFSSLNEVYFSENEQVEINKMYKSCESISFDYGIMEKAGNVHTILGHFGWSDVGTWKSIYELAEKNSEGNVIEGNTMLYDTHNCIIKTPEDKLVVINGLDGFIVAEFEKVLMICKKSDEQKVKQFLIDSKAKFGNSYS